MKTYEQLMKHYWGVIVPMAEAAGIDPWKCVRIYGAQSAQHPSFTARSDHYTFALTVLEGKPVFVGDKLYCKNGGDPYVMSNNFGPHTDWYNATWTPPTKKRTFILGDKELPCPGNGASAAVQISWSINEMNCNNRVFYFNSSEEASLVGNTIDSILRKARDKE